MGKPVNIDYAKCIYGLHAGDGQIRYIGQSTYAAERLANHRNTSRKQIRQHLPVNQWITEVGPENIQYTILEKFSEDQLDLVDEREKFWIEQYRSVTELTNLSDGGYAPYLPSFKRGEEHPRWGAKNSPEHIAAVAKASAERWANMSDEEREANKKKASEKSREYWDNVTQDRKEEINEKIRRGQSMWLTSMTPEELYFKKTRGSHVLHHVKGEKPNPECQHCINEKLA